MKKGTDKQSTSVAAGVVANDSAPVVNPSRANTGIGGHSEDAAISLNGETRARFVLFAIPAADRVDDGPVMRGLLETDAGKINVAAWKKVARDSGNEYLSLKVGNTKPPEERTQGGASDEWLVGPFYGRLFKDVTATRGAKKTRYFGFIEDSVKVGEGSYRTNWQLQIRAKPNVSGDGKTPYIDGSTSSVNARGPGGETALPF